MKKTFGYIGIAALLLFISSDNQQIKNDIDNQVINRHIGWNELLIQKEREYQVYLYSNSCQTCRTLQPFMIAQVLEHQQTLYFIEITREMPFGRNDNLREKKCRLEDLFITAFPMLFIIENHCSVIRIIGKEAISTYYND